MNICLILDHTFSHTKALVCFSQRPCEVSCYSQIKDEENEPQRHERRTWKFPDDVMVSITELEPFLLFRVICVFAVFLLNIEHISCCRHLLPRGKKSTSESRWAEISHHIGPIKTRAGHINSQCSYKLFRSIEESEEQEQKPRKWKKVNWTVKTCFKNINSKIKPLSSVVGWVLNYRKVKSFLNEWTLVGWKTKQKSQCPAS